MDEQHARARERYQHGCGYCGVHDEHALEDELGTLRGTVEELRERVSDLDAALQGITDQIEREAV